MPIVTYENVAEAARTLEARGDRVSVRKVMAELGGGSPNQITPLVAQYKAEKPSIQKPTIPLDPRIQDLIVKQIESVAADAAKAADERAADAAADVELLAETGRATEERVQDLVQELDDARRKAVEDIAAVTVDKEKAEALALERQTEIARLQELLAREQAAAEEARIKVARAQLTVDQQTKELEIKDESLKTTREDLDAIRAAKDQAEKDLAVAQALAKVAEQSIQDEKQKNLDLQKQVDDLRAEKDLLRDDCDSRVKNILDQASAREQAAQARIEALEKSLVDERGKASAASAAEKAAKDQVGDLQKRLDKAEDGLDRAREYYRTLVEESRHGEPRSQAQGKKDALGDALTDQLQGIQRKGKTPSSATQ